MTPAAPTPLSLDGFATGPRLGTTLRFLRALVATSLKEAFANRAAFWMQAAFMLLNNVIWFSTWWIVFARFEHIGGWTLADMTALYGVLCGAFGCAVIFGGGVRDLARTISQGSLDVFLTQPKSPLLHALASKTSSSGWGDVANCFLMLGLSGQLRLDTALPLLVAIVVGATVFLSFGVLMHSLAFWLGPIETLARQLWEFVVTFSAYPETIFPGAMKLLLYTAIPAAFVGWFPSGLVRSFTWSGLAYSIGGAIVFPLLATLVFHAGLRRYASGSRAEVR